MSWFKDDATYGELHDGCGLDSFGGVGARHEDIEMTEDLEVVDELVGELKVSETGG